MDQRSKKRLEEFLKHLFERRYGLHVKYPMRVRELMSCLDMVCEEHLQTSVEDDTREYIDTIYVLYEVVSDLIQEMERDEEKI